MFRYTIKSPESGRELESLKINFRRFIGLASAEECLDPTLEEEAVSESAAEISQLMDSIRMKISTAHFGYLKELWSKQKINTRELQCVARIDGGKLALLKYKIDTMIRGLSKE